MGSSTIGSSAATVPVVVPREPFHINPASPEKSTLIPVRGLPVIPSTSGTMIPVNGTPLASIPPGQQTVVLPGDANGPDLNATPLEFMPIASLNEIVRFDVNPSWVKARWERVSTSPGEYGLHGLRVALVTGVNATDLQGSLTYFFDENQRAQKITFRGWTGNPEPLLQLLTGSYGFKVEPTHWAGLYLAKIGRNPTGAVVLKHPNVIRSQSPAEQVAVMLEFNNPDGPFTLSEEMTNVISIARPKNNR